MQQAPDALNDASTPSDPADAEPPSARGGRLLFAATAMGVLGVIIFVAGIVARGWLGGRMPGLFVMAALLLGLKLGVDRIARRAAPWQGEVITSLGAAGFTPLFVMGALWAMSDPLVMSSWRCGTGEMSMLMGAPIAFFLMGVLGTLFAAGLLGGGRGKVMRPLLRAAAVGATVAAAALVLLSVVRAARKPDVDLYIDSLPVIATLPPLATTAEAPSAPGEGRYAPLVPVHIDIVKDAAVYRVCFESYCSVAVGDATSVAPSLSPMQLSSFGALNAPVTIRADEAHHFLVLEGPRRIAFDERLTEAPPVDPRAPHATLWAAKDINVHDVASGASPPLGWILGGGAALLVMGAIWLARGRTGRRVRAIVGGAPGTLGENGWIHFDDGRPAARVHPAAGAIGPVLLMSDAAAPRGAYRESDLLDSSRVVAGTRADHAERDAAAAAIAHGWILAVALLGTAPLFAAATVGLLY